jgi:hypothetical protein
MLSPASTSVPLSCECGRLAIRGSHHKLTLWGTVDLLGWVGCIADAFLLPPKFTQVLATRLADALGKVEEARISNEEVWRSIPRAFRTDPPHTLGASAG